MAEAGRFLIAFIVLETSFILHHVIIFKAVVAKYTRMHYYLGT